jgi:hypothetical protein
MNFFGHGNEAYSLTAIISLRDCSTPDLVFVLMQNSSIVS